MIDVAAVPDGLKYPVGKAKRQNILDSFFAEIMINAVNLLFFGDLQQLLVQYSGRIQVVTKRFFYNHTAPVMVVFFHQPHLGQMLDDRAEKIGGCSQVEEKITVRSVILIDFLQKIF